MTRRLIVGNQNYSSWSLRPWLVLTWGGLPFETHVIELGGPGYGERAMPSVLEVSPTGTVPVLQIEEGDAVHSIWDSLAIALWAAELAPSLWPADRTARAHARSITCEMHAGFSALRQNLPCNIRRRTEPRPWSPPVLRDIDRVAAIWTDCLGRYGGPYLFGEAPTIADAFYTPIATRFRTYGVTVSREAAKYQETALSNEAFLAWEAAGKKETWTMPVWDAY